MKRPNMREFERPSRIFWSGVAKQLSRQGRTEDQIVEILQSKYSRHLLDRFEDELEGLARELAAKTDEGKIGGVS